LKNDDGETPFSAGCRRGQVTVVEVMLKDPRVDITPDDIDGRTPLWWASRNGHHEILERLIARSSDLGDLKNKKGKMIGKDYTALEIARNWRGLKLHHCWKDSWPTMRTPVMRFE